MEKSVFKLLFKGKEYPIHSIKRYLNDIPSNVSDTLIFNPDHAYQVTSKVSDQVFESFVQYIITNTPPNINIGNIEEFSLLNDEFNLLSKELEKKKLELGDFLLNLSLLRTKHNDPAKMRLYEEDISSRLDEYIEKYGEELLNLPIQPLYNIFNHSKRRLTKHNEVYELIKRHFERTNDASIFVLLETLDGTKLSEKNIEESLLKSGSRMNFTPKIDFRFLSSSFEKQKHLEEQIVSLAAKIESFNEKQSKGLESLMSRIEEIAKRVEVIDSKQKIFDEHFSSLNDSMISMISHSVVDSFVSEVSRTEPGILQVLKEKQNSSFDRLFIASQSSDDLYNLIDPKTRDRFCSTNDGDFFIEFELEKEVCINGVKIFSHSEDFPKSFNIEVDGRTMKKITNATALNGKFKEMTVNFDSVSGRKVRFVQTGPNWDRGNNFLYIKRIDILSTNREYSKGVFATLIDSCKSHDPHKCNVAISASCFDFNRFCTLDSKRNISTSNHENEWFQVELTKGFAVLRGFRLKRSKAGKLKNYKIICTNDVKKSIEKWTTLIEINENREDEHRKLDVYEFPKPSPPSKFVRLIQTGPNWSGSMSLKFYHFDIFGNYF